MATIMNLKAYVPSAVSALRLVALPIFLYCFSVGDILACILVFGLSQVTDLIDGYAARKLGVTSKVGAYFDVITDFIFITGIFTAFTLSGYYPAWIMALIAASFAQFIISSIYTKKLYDPLGRYIGSVLYIAIGLTLLSPTPIIFTVVEVGFPMFALTSFVTRTASFAVSYRSSMRLQKIKPLKRQNPECITG
jgi:CDP-diacylglycerol---glycerol-3-phosphate 3-phosphatidyltransferase